jgi:hypothetical protein
MIAEAIMDKMAKRIPCRLPNIIKGTGIKNKIKVNTGM